MADEKSKFDFEVLSVDQLRELSRARPDDAFDVNLARNDNLRLRDSAKDSAVNILDTLQSIGSIAKAPLPGESNTLQQAVENSRILDQLRSPAYLQEQEFEQEDLARAMAEGGEWGGFKQAVANTLVEGGNLGPDVASQVPYLMIGPAARAMGVASRAAVPSVLSRTITGTGNVALTNRIAALSGVLEGSGAYGQTYDRAFRQTGDEEEATRQAMLSGAFNTVVGTALGKLTPGFELDPLGLNHNPASQFLGDVLAPALSNVVGEVVEESGMALSQTVSDNVLAGKKPLEGVGAAVGEAAAVSSVFSGGMQSPGLIRDTSVAIGKGVTSALQAAAAGVRGRGTTAQQAAVAAAQGAVQTPGQNIVDTEATASSAAGTEEVIQSTEPVAPATDNADSTTVTTDEPAPTATSVMARLENEGPELNARAERVLANVAEDSEPAQRISAAANAVNDLMQAEDTTPEAWTTAWEQLHAEVTAAEQALLPPAAEATAEETPAPRVLPSSPEEQYTLPLGEPPAKVESANPAVAAVLTANALERQVDTTEEDSEAQMRAIDRVEQIERSGGVAEAEQAVTQVSEAEMIEALKQAAQGDTESQQLVHAVAQTDLSKLPDAAIPAAQRPLAQTMREVRSSGGDKVSEVTDQILNSGFEAGGKAIRKRRGINSYASMVANALRIDGDKPGNKPARRMAVFMRQLETRAEQFRKALEEAKTTTEAFVDVAGTGTLDEDGKLIDKPFRIWVNNAKSLNAARQVIKDAVAARQVYEQVKAIAPKMMAEAENYASIELERMGERTGKPSDAVKKPLIELSALGMVFTTDNKQALALLKALAAEGIKAKADGNKITLATKDKAAAMRLLEKLKAGDAPVAAKTPTAPATPTPPASAAPAATDAAQELEQKIADTIAKVDSAERLAKVRDRIIAIGEKLSEAAKVRLRQAFRVKRDELRAKADAEKAAEAKKRVEPTKPAEVKPAQTKSTEEKKEEKPVSTLDERLQLDDVKKLLAELVLNAQWVQRGGSIIREDNSDYKSPVVGRTTWLNSALWWDALPYRDAANRLSLKEIKAIVQNVVDGKKIRSNANRQRAVLQALLDWVDAQQRQENTNTGVSEDIVDEAADETNDETNEAEEEARLEREAIQAEGNVTNPLLHDSVKWMTDTFKRVFRIQPDNSVQGWLEKMTPEQRDWLLKVRPNVIAQMDKLISQGLVQLMSDKPFEEVLIDIQNKPYGVASHLLIQKEDGTYTLPQEVKDAFATAAALQLIRGASRYDTPFDDDGDLRRDAYAEVWAREIANDAMRLLGARGKRTESETLVQGIPLTFGLMTVQALINQTDKEGNSLYFEGVTKNKHGEFALPRVPNEKGWETQVVVPRTAIHEGALKRLDMVNEIIKVLGGELIYEASLTPYTETSDRVNHTDTKTSEAQKKANLNRQQIPYYRNPQLQKLLETLKGERLVQLLTGWYDQQIDADLPAPVQRYIKGLRGNWFNQVRAADAYDKLIADNNDTPIYMKHGVNRNGRTSSKMGPQDHKLLRDLYSSARVTLDLSDESRPHGITQLEALKMTLAQAFGGKTDIYSPQEVLKDYEENIKPKREALARALHEAMKTGDSNKVFELLKRDTPYAPRELSALLTLGRLLEQGEQGSFETWLAFEIDGKTNGAFNTEMFFGLGAIDAANLEQGGLMLDKPDTTWAAERPRVETLGGKDFYVRIGNAAEGMLKGIFAKALAKTDPDRRPQRQRQFNEQLELLEAAGLLKRVLETAADGKVTETFVFERLSGKTASLPVQYGGSVSGVQSQIWGLMQGNLVKKYLELRAKFERTSDVAEQRKLRKDMIKLQELMQGMDSRGKDLNDIEGPERFHAARWQFATRNISQALLDAYKIQKPTVTALTGVLVQLTNLAFAVKAAQWQNATTEKLKANPLNQKLADLFGARNRAGGKVNGFALSKAETEEVKRGTIDMSFSTDAGRDIISLNDTDNESNTFAVRGFGTNLTGHLNIPVPKPPGVSVLALLTIGAGDAAMGTRFFQTLRMVTDVYDGLEFKANEFMQGGEELNEAAWEVVQYDVLKDFFKMMKEVRTKLQTIQEAQDKAGDVLDLRTLIVNTYNNEQVDEDEQVKDFNEFVLKVDMSVQAFDRLYREQQAGQANLQSRDHTMLQMGGGKGKTIRGKPIVREMLDELSLVEDVADTVEVTDLSQAGGREAGRFPEQYKVPTSTRIEDAQGLIDVDMRGARWRGTNTWNAPGAQKGAGLKRLLNVLAMARDAGKPYDSDVSVHQSALKMYLRAIDNGLITAEFDRAAVEAAIANNQPLRSSEPIFKNVQLTARAANAVQRVDNTLKTAFEVANGQLDRSGVIAALDQVKWKNPIQRAVWKRLRALLPADLRVHLVDTQERWATVKDKLGARASDNMAGLTMNSLVLMRAASTTVMLHELVHTVFTRTIANYFSNINSVPVELRGPINDLVQLLERFKKLSPVGRVGFIQKVIRRLEFVGDKAGELDEMLTYVISDAEAIDQLQTGFAARVMQRVRQILNWIFGVKVPASFMDDTLAVFNRLADGVLEARNEPVPVGPAPVRAYLSSLEQLTEDAYADLWVRMSRGQKMPPTATLDAERIKAMQQAQSQYNLSVDQQRLFTRVFSLLRQGQRSPELEQFVSTTLPEHPQKNLFNGSKDLVAAVMALAAVEPTFREQLEVLWVTAQTERSTVEGLIDRALNNGQTASVEKMLTKAFSDMLVDQEYNNSWFGTRTARLDRLGSAMLDKLGLKALDASQNAPEGVSALLKGVAALTSEKGAEAFGKGFLALVNGYGDQRWLQDLAAALLGTAGDGKLLYRAHAEMIGAISATRAVFDTNLPKALKGLFPEGFDGWATLYQSFGRLGVEALGSSAREMYLNDAERRRMITVLESRLPNAIDAQNLGYYLANRRTRPGSAQPLLRNARAIADNLNGTRRRATDAQVDDVDQLITLHAIEALSATERAKVARMFREHPEPMQNLIGMLKHTNEAATKHLRTDHQYVYWKGALPQSTDPRSSVLLAGAIDGAKWEKLGYVKGPRYQRTAGDPISDLHYYTRAYAPSPVFTQGVIATVQQTAMGINYTTAATISPDVGTMITDRRMVEYIKRHQGRDSSLVPVFNFQGEIVGYERLLDPTIVDKHLKANHTQLHISIGKQLGRITEENMARTFNKAAVKLIHQDWVEGQARGEENEYESVNSSTDKQIARAWEVVPKEVKKELEELFGGPVMVRKHLVSNTLGYYKAGVLDIYTGDASMSESTRKTLIGLANTVLIGPRATQIVLAAEAALKEGVATAKDLIITRSLSVPYNNFMAAAHLVIANGVPLTEIVKTYQQGIREVVAYYRLQKEIINLTVQIAGATTSGEKDRLRAIQTTKYNAIKRLEIYPLIESGDLSDLPEGLEEAQSHTYLGDLSGWLDRHLRTKLHPKAPLVMANILFAKDSELHNAMSKAIQAGDFLARFAIYKHMLKSGATVEEARDRVRDELVSYQTNPGRFRASLEDYGLLWWSQFTLRAQAVLLRRFRQNPFSFFVAQMGAQGTGSDGPLDMNITERGLDNSTGLDQMINAPTAHILWKAF